LTAPRRHRDGRSRRSQGSALFAAGVFLLTGGAFVAGYRLRTHRGQDARLTPAAQLAQAASPHAGRATTVAGNAASARTSAPYSQDRSRHASAAAETFENVYNLVREHYVDPLPSETLMSRGTVKGIIAALNDPNSYFLEPAQVSLLQAEAEGRFAGIGAVTALRSTKKDGVTEHKIAVVAPLPGSPAEKAGLKPRDIITHIDGKWVLGASPLLDYNRILKKYEGDGASEEELDRAADSARKKISSGIRLHAALGLLRQGSGTRRVLTVERPGVAKPLRIELTTAVTQVDPVVEARPITVNHRQAAYVKVRAFTEGADEAFRRALEGLPTENGVVLDLRGNPGGSLKAAQAIEAALSPGGTFLVETGANGKKRPLSSPLQMGRKLPRVAVLVDSGTASTAEAVAAALQDKQAGTLVGTRTFGDGLMQTLYPLPDGSGFTLTTGRMSGPRGTSWDRNGLTPKVALKSGAPESAVLAQAVAALRPATLAQSRTGAGSGSVK